VLTDVRSEIWMKLWGNLTFNPISALTHATLKIFAASPRRALATAMMREAQAVGEAFGIRFRLSIEKRSWRREHWRAQDLDAAGHRTGRATEVDALLGSVIELARLVNMPTPHLEAVYAVTKLLDETVARSGSGRSFAPPEPVRS
jgi:2-dehydropantoate 2-reductase